MILLYGLLLALHHRARRISLNLVLAYVGMFFMLSLAHTCGTLHQGDGTPAHAHKVTAPRAVQLTPTHDCLACAWERNTTAPPSHGFMACVVHQAVFAAPRSGAVPLHTGTFRLLPSRGPPTG